MSTGTPAASVSQGLEGQVREGTALLGAVWNPYARQPRRPEGDFATERTWEFREGASKHRGREPLQVGVIGRRTELVLIPSGRGRMRIVSPHELALGEV